MLERIAEAARQNLDQVMDTVQKQAENARKFVRTEAERNLHDQIELVRSYHENLQKGVHHAWETVQNTQQQLAERMKEKEQLALFRSYQENLQQGMQQTWEAVRNTERQLAERLKENIKFFHGSWPSVFDRSASQDSQENKSQENNSQENNSQEN